MSHDACSMAQVAQIGNMKQDLEEVSDLRGGPGAQDSFKLSPQKGGLAS